MYIWTLPPIDIFNHALVAEEEETVKILALMPESVRSMWVHKIYVPYENELVPVYISKADNNGTTYLFSEHDVISYLLRNTEIYNKED